LTPNAGRRGPITERDALAACSSVGGWTQKAIPFDVGVPAAIACA
jgi:hypothetical protein